MYKLVIKPFLFLLDPEKAHHFTLKAFSIMLKIPIINQLIKQLYKFDDPQLESNFLDLTFKNPIGLAAGFDKDGKYYDTMSHLGFGFIEIGTVTPKPQKGNDTPRLFRLPQDESIINRMGFNNDGVDAMVERLKRRKKNNLILGGNIGKNKTTPNDEAYKDYEICFRKLHPHVDYFVVNVSSPNTPGLRELQEKEPLLNILNRLKSINEEEIVQRPILLKIAPDLNNSQLDDIIDIVRSSRIDGIIATNTTISRDHLKTSKKRIEDIGNGGLSGKIIQDKSTEVISYIHEKSNGEIFIIGVGGINGPEECKKKMNAGASLVQVYSSMIYEGPGMIKSIKKSLIS